MSEKTEMWYYSTNGEQFNHGPENSKAEIIALAIEEGEKIVWVGRRVAYEPFSGDLIDTLLEQEYCDAQEIAGEAADDWPPHKSEIDPLIYDRINEQIRSLMRGMVGHPGFWSIVDVEKWEEVGGSLEPHNHKSRRYITFLH